MSSSSRSRSNSNSSFRRPLSLLSLLLLLSLQWWKEQHLLEARILGPRALTACVRRVIMLLNAFRLLTKRARYKCNFRGAVLFRVLNPRQRFSLSLSLSLSGVSNTSALRVQQKIRFLKTENTFCILSSKKNIQHTVLSCCSLAFYDQPVNVPKMNASTFCAHVFTTRVFLPFSRRRVFSVMNVFF